MHALLLLTVANIKSFTRDRAAMFWTLAFPLIFIFLFGAIFSGGDNTRDIGFADGDSSQASEALRGGGAYDIRVDQLPYYHRPQIPHPPPSPMLRGSG